MNRKKIDEWEREREMKPTFHLTFSLSFIRINQQLYDGLKNGNLNNIKQWEQKKIH